MRRFFIDESALSGGGALARIEGGEYNHIVNALRLRAGGEVVLCLNDGLDRIARIERIEKKFLTAEVLRVEKNGAESDVNCALFQALVKSDKLEWIAQKATELGIKRIVPFVSEFAAVKAETARAQRLQTVCVEAAKQCGRAVTPAVSPVLGFKEAVAELRAYNAVIFPYEKERKNPIGAALETARARQKKAGGGAFSIGLAIGGEGGFSEREAEELKAAGALACTLGKRILRAETAAIVAAGIVMNALEN